MTCRKPKRQQAAPVAAGQCARGAGDPGGQVHIPCLPVFPERAQPDGRQKQKEGSSLRQVLGESQQVYEQGDDDDATAHAHQSDQETGGEPEQ